MPELAARRGHDIVSSSGDTLLGADDKAGVAEIITAVAHLAAHPELPRPPLKVCFTPDEEIGEGATLFDIERFGALCAYTIDGSGLGGLDDETFSADEAIITVTGVDVHPGQATGKLVSALRVAAEIVAELPSDRLTPDTTSGREGFIHPYELTGSAARAEIRLIIRDFDEQLLHEHVELLRDTAERVVDRAPGRDARARRAPAVPQHARVSGRGSRGHRGGRARDPRGGDRAGPDSDPRRHRRLAAVGDGAADAEHLHRRPRVPLGPRVGVAAGHGGRGRDDRPSRRGLGARRRSIRSAMRRAPSGWRWGDPMSDFGPNSLASLDGEIMLASEAVIPVTDEGLIRGDGAFEVIRVYDGIPYAFDAHIARLQRTGANIRLPIDLEAVRADSHRLLAQAGTGEDAQLLRIMITRGGRRILLTEQMPRMPDEARLMSVTYSPTRMLDGAKTLSYAANMLAGRLAREQGYDEALLVTPHGRVLEAPTSSIFYVIDGELFTPPLDEHILASITRALVIDVTEARRAQLHAGAAQGGRRGVPRLDRPRGPAGVGDRRPRVRAGRGRSASGPRRRPAERIQAELALLKILTVIGNRPQFIKAAAVSPILRSRHAETLVHTGQHFDDRLSAIFFSELGPAGAGPAARDRARLGQLADRTDAGRARAGARRGRARRGARLRRHELDARRRARRRPGGRPGRPRRGGDAVVRPRDARGAQPRADRPRLVAAAVLERGRGRATCAPRASRRRASSSAT